MVLRNLNLQDCLFLSKGLFLFDNKLIPSKLEGIMSKSLKTIFVKRNIVNIIFFFSLGLKKDETAYGLRRGLGLRPEYIFFPTYSYIFKYKVYSLTNNKTLNPAFYLINDKNTKYLWRKFITRFFKCKQEKKWNYIFKSQLKRRLLKKKMKKFNINKKTKLRIKLKKLRFRRRMIKLDVQFMNLKRFIKLHSKRQTIKNKFKKKSYKLIKRDRRRFLFKIVRTSDAIIKARTKSFYKQKIYIKNLKFLSMRIKLYLNALFYKEHIKGNKFEIIKIIYLFNVLLYNSYQKFIYKR